MQKYRSQEDRGRTEPLGSMSQPKERTALRNILVSKPILEVKNLKKHFTMRSGLFSKTTETVYAVNGVSFSLVKGETLGLVGESGCGKSTIARSILRLIEATAGQIFFDGHELLTMDKNKLKQLRKHMQIIFQDPFSSLNPRMSVGEIVGDALLIHGVRDRSEREHRIGGILHKVGMQREHMNRYPHEFSGGQRQRIGIARALVLEPKLVVCDEPVSALDVSIQAQIINMLMDLQGDMDLSYIFIAHDLSVVEHISTRVAVMYLGKIVELADKDDLYRHPMHPYVEALLSAVPVANPRIKPQRIILEGDVPTPTSLPSGCSLSPRCRRRMDICNRIEPEFKKVEASHFVACHLY